MPSGRRRIAKPFGRAPDAFGEFGLARRGLRVLPLSFLIPRRTNVQNVQRGPVPIGEMRRKREGASSRVLKIGRKKNAVNLHRLETATSGSVKKRRRSNDSAPPPSLEAAPPLCAKRHRREGDESRTPFTPTRNRPFPGRWTPRGEVQPPMPCPGPLPYRRVHVTVASVSEGVTRDPAVVGQTVPGV